MAAQLAIEVEIHAQYAWKLFGSDLSNMTTAWMGVMSLQVS